MNVFRNLVSSSLSIDKGIEVIISYSLIESESDPAGEKWNFSEILYETKAINGKNIMMGYNMSSRFD